MKRSMLGLVLLVAGCAGGAEVDEGDGATTVETTAGGEAEPVEEVVLPATVPVPVPQPATPRAEMSATLQEVWSLVEQAVEVRPPAPPEDASEGAIEAWAEGPFAEWLALRQEANQRAQALVATLGEDTADERLVAAALFGYMFEDMASGIRGAPVPEAIASDSELLGIYVETLHELLDPVARLAAEAYLICRELALGLDEEAGWGEWAGYCDGRGLEVVETFGLLERAPGEPESTSPGADSAEGADETAAVDVE